MQHIEDLPDKGIILSVLRSSGGACTAGPSATADEILVVGKRIPRIFSARSDARTLPTYALRNLRGCLNLVPIDVLDGGANAGVWVMASGTYATSTDSRWWDLVRELEGGGGSPVVAIHDRAELAFGLGGGLVALTGRRDEVEA
jgi:hypothetical protein